MKAAQVRFWLYLEGCDEHCSNAVQNLDGALQLGFARRGMQMEKGAVHSETTLSNMVPGGDSHCGPAGPDSGYLRLVYFQ